MLLTLGVRDENDQPTTASFVIRDRQGRIYPSQSKRLAPDFAFQPQVYRSDGETIRLPAGEYTFAVTRGPEYLAESRNVTVGDKPLKTDFHLKRWIDPSPLGWWSGDHHIHAAGCAHYNNPTEGVLPQDMIRHCEGEDLKVGCNLTWGPCFENQKQFFTGQMTRSPSFPTCFATTSRSPASARTNRGICACFVSRTISIPGRFRFALADALPQHAKRGERPRRGVRPGPQRMGPDARPMSCRIT